jgi:two-component system cell cycle response regulator
MLASITVLAVEDDDDDADLLAFAFTQTKDRRYETQRVRSLAEFLDQAERVKPDIVLLDLHLPDSRGIETVRRALVGAHGVPIVVLTGSEGTEIGLKAIEAGAQDFVPKTELLSPLLSRAVDFAIQRGQIAQAREQEALHDHITGLPNRLAFFRQLDAAVARADRDGRPFAVAFIDLDGFKLINDNFGHAAGDEVLATVGRRCRACSRANDHLGRLGGDEFVILLDGASDIDQAINAATRYTSTIEESISLQAAANTPVRVGASVGRFVAHRWNKCAAIARCGRWSDVFY